jgi:hypothetical protein
MINFTATDFTDLHELLEWKEEVDKLVKREVHKEIERKTLLNINEMNEEKKDSIRREMIKNWLIECNIEEFDKSEETESGVFGVHIVFERKNDKNKDKNKDEINPIEIVEKLLKTSKIISITEDTPDIHNPYQKETTVKFITNINPENN